jgi:hypothetical protein
VNDTPITLSASNGDGNRVLLMALAAGLFFCMGIVPPLFAQSSRRRRRRLGIDEYYDEDRPGDYR